MISAKFRLKEERRKVLKLSAWKLRRVEDAESCLRRSVLIHNTLRRLQRDARGPRSPPAALKRRADAPPTQRDVHADADADDCDVQDVLSQFYMPPTPRMLTTIDEEAMEPEAKRSRLCGNEDEEEEQVLTRTVTTTDVQNEGGDTEVSPWPSPAGGPSPAGAPSPPLTCAQTASLLSDSLQTPAGTAFGGLVASVES